MKFKKFEIKILIVLSIMIIVIEGGFLITSSQNTKMVTYNHLVGLTIEIQNKLDALKIEYYAYFGDPLNENKHKENLTHVIAQIEQVNDQFGQTSFPLASESFDQYGKKFMKLGTLLKSSTTFQQNHIELIMTQIENVESSNGQVKQIVISEIKQINKNIKIISQMMAILVVVGIAGVLLIVKRDMLDPVKGFTSYIVRKTEFSEIDYEDYKDKSVNALSNLIHYYNQYVNKLKIITDLGDKIYAQNSFDEVLDFVFNACKPFIPFNRIGIAVITEDGKHIKALRAKSDYTIFLRKNYTESLYNSTLSDIIKNNKYRIINDLETYLKQKPSSESTKLILAEGLNSSITLPLQVDNKVVGVIFFSSKLKYAYNMTHVHFLSSISNSLTISFEKSFVYDDLILASVKGFASIVESKDNVTGNHLDRMSNYTKFIAEMLYDENQFINEIDEAFIDQIFKFSTLHDIGKVGIGDVILNKPGKLTPEEFDEMKKHSVIGYQILRNMSQTTYFSRVDFFQTAMNIVKSHHEKYNGKGYPEGLCGESIPLEARIVAVADVFDALVSERPYKKAFSFEEAISMIIQESGSHFDPIIVESLKRHEASFKVLYEKMR